MTQWESADEAGTPTIPGLVAGVRVAVVEDAGRRRRLKTRWKLVGGGVAENTFDQYQRSGSNWSHPLANSVFSSRRAGRCRPCRLASAPRSSCTTGWLCSLASRAVVLAWPSHCTLRLVRLCRSCPRARCAARSDRLLGRSGVVGQPLPGLARCKPQKVPPKCGRGADGRQCHGAVGNGGSGRNAFHRTGK